MGAPVANLERLLEALERGEPLAPDIAAWLHAGAAQYVTGRVRSLDAALRLSGPGMNHPGRTLALRARNAALQMAADALPPDQQHADGLAAAVFRFETRTLPRLRSATVPPETLDPLQRALFDAYAAGVRVPTSARHLRRLVRIADTKPPVLMS